MPILLLAYLSLCTAWWAFELYVGRRQAACVQRHREQVPAAFAASVTLEEHRRSADFTRDRLRLDGFASVMDLVITFVALLWALDFVTGLVSGWMAPSIGRSLVILGILALGSSLLSLPLAAARDLGLEQRYGFNRKTPGLFIRDRLKGMLLTVLIGGPMVAGILWALQNLKGPWWIYTWAALTVLMLAAPTVYVRLIAPWFNRFTPLDGELAARLEALLVRCGFRSDGLFEMDASRRSSRGNAFFVGFGPTKRIVLFDTLLEKHAPDEIEAIVAHELGHFKHRHTLTGALRSIVTLFAMLAVVGWLCRQPWLLPGFGMRHADPALGLLLGFMLASAASPVLGLFGRAISRRHEFQADDFARSMVGAEPMVSALTRLARDNASTLTPDPLFSLVHDTHPPVPVRVAHLLA